MLSSAPFMAAKVSLQFYYNFCSILAVFFWLFIHIYTPYGYIYLVLMF